MLGSWTTSVQQLPAFQYAAADAASPSSNIPAASRDANGAMSSDTEEDDGAAACPCPATSCTSEGVVGASTFGCAAKVNTGNGGGGGGAKRDASAAA